MEFMVWVQVSGSRLRNLALALRTFMSEHGGHARNNAKPETRDRAVKRGAPPFDLGRWERRDSEMCTRRGSRTA